MKVCIRRKSPGGARARNGVTSDVYMSKVSNSGRRLGISIRLSGKCMDTLRWRPGDLVLIDFSREGNSGRLELTRTDSQDQGLAISQLGSGKSAQIRGSLDPSEVSVLFPNGQVGYHGQLSGSTLTEGSFVFDYESH